MSYYREQLESWLKTIDVKADRVIDIGGSSNPVISRVKSFQSNEYICFDLGKEAPKMEYVKFDLNLPLEQLAGYDERSFGYDCLFCLEVFEYIWNPVEAFKNINRLMCKDGVAYISFPAIYPVHNPYEIDYLRYTKMAIEKYLAEFHFSVASITPRVATEGVKSLAEFYSKEGMHPLRGSALPLHIGYLVKAFKSFVPIDSGNLKE